VGLDGHVVATDLNPRSVEALDYPQLETRRHHIVTDELEEGAYDLIHTRFVLNHLAGQHGVLESTLTQLVAALKPGGWLLLEEIDYATAVTDPRSGERFSDLVGRFVTAAVQIVGAIGGDLYYGRRLYWDLRAQHLTDVEAEGRAPLLVGGSPTALMWRITVENLRSPIIASGHLSAAEVDELCALFTSPESCWLYPATVAAWGRRPPVA
jgi:hypothetical protein